MDAVREVWGKREGNPLQRGWAFYVTHFVFNIYYTTVMRQAKEIREKTTWSGRDGVSWIAKDSMLTAEIVEERKILSFLPQKKRRV